TLTPLIFPLPLTHIVSVSAWPTLGSIARHSIAAAVVPTIQRHANFGEAGMLTPSIFFCLSAVPPSNNDFIPPLLGAIIMGGHRCSGRRNPATSSHSRCCR